MNTEINELQEFDVVITETLKKTVQARADNLDEAEQIVHDQWRNSEHILVAEDFVSVEFEASPVSLELSRDAQTYENGGSGVMSADAKIAQQSAASEPLAENQYVRELFSILRDNGRDPTELAALLVHVGEMESFVKRAEGMIVEMKSQLDEMKEVQSHPVKTALQNAIKNLEQKVAEAKERLSELKAGIIDGCKSAVEAFKEKGISALHNIASFFHIKDGLQGLEKGIDSIIKADDRAVAKIEAFASEYHAAGGALKNMARIVVGRQPVDAKKEAGKLAKAMSAPYKAQKSALTGLKNSIGKASTSLGRLEQSEKARQTAREAFAQKPSLMGQLKEAKAVSEMAKREHRAHELAKGAEL